MLNSENITFTLRNKSTKYLKQEHSKHRTGKAVANPAVNISKKAFALFFFKLPPYQKLEVHAKSQTYC